jgi:hypothetical protein
MGKKKDSEPTEFPEKWNKVLKEIPEFKDTADAASTDDLKKIIIQCENNISVTEKAKGEDARLAGAKEIVKEAGAPYRDAVKVQTAKIKYALFLLEGQGVDLDK